MTNYRQYIISSEWRKFCFEIIRERRCCEACGASGNFNVHHKTYKNLGCEKPEDVALLCRGCHVSLHDFHLVNGGKLAKASEIFIKRKRNGTFKMPQKKKERVFYLKPPLKQYLLTKKKKKLSQRLKEGREIQQKEKELALIRAEAKRQHL